MLKGNLGILDYLRINTKEISLNHCMTQEETKITNEILSQANEMNDKNRSEENHFCEETYPGT